MRQKLTMGQLTVRYIKVSKNSIKIFWNVEHSILRQTVVMQILYTGTQMYLLTVLLFVIDLCLCQRSHLFITKNIVVP